MDICVLGPFRATQDGVPLHLTAVKPRKVFALLALQANRLVPVPALVEEVWGERPPRSVHTTLQTYILQLRNLIGTALGDGADAPPGGAKSILVTEPGGYRLDTQGGLIDAQEFHALADAGHKASEQGDWQAAAAHFGKALALWRGPALTDVQCGVLLEAEAVRLDESRMSALHGQIEAGLRLGRHHALIGELSALTTRHPLYEDFHEQLMIALYRAGRRGDALSVYHRLRASLKEGLGLDPSPGIEYLHRAVLDSSPHLVLDGSLPDHVPTLARAN
ncbi:BTAD domain-containing putative transcriptional regulator [Streptomyces sp. Da 82-17]|uniref:AfsR/SARP family transcriptional regulator n=1 Tax=Streptomyces sp. Da 82-17 TaxID=3377116 RepID=UPI0038D4984F